MLFLLNRIMRELTERGAGKRFEPPRPVISVGNIHFGGTGKTPHMMYIANFLLDRGYKVCVLTRGYKRKTSGYQLFTHGVIPDSPETTGDEPFMVKKEVPEVVLCVGANRRESMNRVLVHDDVDLFLLDDGYQQFHMQKDFDVVLLRYEDIPELGKRRNHFLLRESPVSLTYADFVVISKTPGDFEEDTVKPFQQRYFRDVDIAFTRYRASGISSNAAHPSDISMDEEFFLFGGMADFGGFLVTAREYGIKVGGFHSLPDHATYSGKTVKDLRNRAGGMPLLTSGKDIVKLPSGIFGEIFSLAIEVEFLEGKELFENKILRSVENR